ncbi:MAG: hypothetical protein ACJ76F_08025, partial [Bacteroidia bacterium]
KFVVRANIELFTGKISLAEYFNRAGDFFKNKWQCIDELIAFNKQAGVPSSFFIGVQNGMGLSYTNQMAAYWIRRMLEAGCEVNVHGIEFETLEQIRKEHEIFSKISGSGNFGLRMHYVRTNEHTLTNLAKAGYIFDSTEHSFKDPYKIGSMWEFPFQVMDGWVIEKGKRWQTQSLQQAKDNTLALIERAQKENLSYLGIDFHDRYFSKSFNTWIDWYTWVVQYLEQNGIAFVNFKQAISELESQPHVTGKSQSQPLNFNP